MTSLVPLALAFLAISFVIYKRFTRISIANIPGPRDPSFILGHLGQLADGEAAETEFKWQAQFGDVFRIKGLFGEDRLMISDPKAIQHIVQKSGYNFPKTPERRELARMISGTGLTWADGDIHKRLRKVMLPGFTASEAKGSLPVFVGYARKMGNIWKGIVASSNDGSPVVNVNRYISLCTLDAIGKVAFDYQFGALDDDQNKLGKAFSNLVFKAFGTPSKSEIFLQNFIGYMPESLRRLLVDHVPSKKLSHSRRTAKLAIAVSKKLISEKSAAYSHGKSGQDIMSLLVQANKSESESTKLNEEELLGVMRIITLAGHETTANTFTWMLLELTRHPEIQKKLRDEIRSMKRSIQNRGSSSYTVSDLDSMPYLNAVLKETLRYHSVVLHAFRIASKDDILPLSKPIVTTSGARINEVPVPKGLRVTASIAVYNRNEQVFGHDAHVFDPERWLDSRIDGSVSLGVVENLMTFSGGIRSCIGWRFALVELQAFIFELVGDFEFLATPESQKIRREAAIVMVPTIEGQVEKGAQLPLRVRLASTEV